MIKFCTVLLNYVHLFALFDAVLPSLICSSTVIETYLIIWNIP